jgi:ubiquitin carboxyl-terminal hydrolase 34
LKDIPDHLIFNLKRFDFDITTMTRCKVNDEFRFPDSIDMAPYNVESLSNPEKPTAPDMFELVGILVHSGTAESGHYYSYIRERPTLRSAFNSWVQFNDIDVSVFDSQRIPDSCYGGVELTSTTLQLSKSHNAYMLFYQRVSSIQQFETAYNNHDALNPVRLPFSDAHRLEIDAQNQDTIRSYCLQDPSHARFMRLLLEQMPSGLDHQCSTDHSTETRMIRHSLEYVQQISCRFKEMPEFEASCKLLQDAAGRCFGCAAETVSFFADADCAIDEVHKESVLRSAVLRNPNTTVRRAFASMLCEALRCMKRGAGMETTPEESAKSRETQYREGYTACISGLLEPWAELHKSARAWNDYFDLLSRLTGLGSWEVGIVLYEGLLEKMVEIIWADARHDPMELRARYFAYVSLREKGRVFGLSGLIACLSTLLESMAFSTRYRPEDEPCTAGEDGRYALTVYEATLLRPTRMTQKQKPSLEWLRKITMTKQNPNAVAKIVATLVEQNVLNQALEATLASGLATETIGDAIAFLEPTIVFCRYCRDFSPVQQLVKEALSGIDSIGSSCGKEHLEFITELIELENEAAGLRRQDFFTLVFRQVKCWAPVLLLFPDDLQYDVRGDTVRFLREQLFEPLENSKPDTAQQEVLTKYARTLARSCVLYIQQNHLPRAGKQVGRIEVGQALHVTRIIQHVCENYFGGGEASDDQFVSEAMSTLEHLQVFTQESADAVSDEWPENESGAGSESDNQDFQEWNEPTS